MGQASDLARHNFGRMVSENHLSEVDCILRKISQQKYRLMGGAIFTDEESWRHYVAPAGYDRAEEIKLRNEIIEIDKKYHDMYPSVVRANYYEYEYYPEPLYFID